MATAGEPIKDDIFRFMIQTNGLSSCTMSKLEHQFTGMTKEEIISWFRRNNDRFELIEDDANEVHLVNARVLGLKLCAAYQTSRCSRGVACPNLHLCRDHAGSGCNVRCRRNHSLQDGHTSNLLNRNGLLDLSDDQVLTVIKQSNLQVCGEYNVQDGVCPHADSCRRIHICRDYVKGRCNHIGDCVKSHSVDSAHSQRLLRNYQLDTLPHLKILEQLWVVKGKTGHRQAHRLPIGLENVVALNIEDNDDDSDDEDNAAAAAAADAAAADIALRSVTVHVRQNDDVTTICSDNLKGQCEYGDQCRHHHCLETVLWQVKFLEEWTSFCTSECERLEEALKNSAEVTSVKFPAAAVGGNTDVNIEVNIGTLVGTSQIFGEPESFPIRRLNVLEKDAKARRSPQVQQVLINPRIRDTEILKRLTKNLPKPPLFGPAKTVPVPAKTVVPRGNHDVTGVAAEMHTSEQSDDHSVVSPFRWDVLAFDEWLPFEKRQGQLLEDAYTDRSHRSARTTVKLPEVLGKPDITVDLKTLVGETTLFDEPQSLPIRRQSREIIGDTKEGSSSPERGATLKEQVLWYWRNRDGWELFDKNDQAVIEKAYQEHKVSVEIRGAYTIDFSLFHQINLTTKRHREVKRDPPATDR